MKVKIVKTIFLPLYFVLGGFGSLAGAQTKHVHNFDEIELKGVRLGASVDEALQGLMEFYSLNVDDIRISSDESHMPITDRKSAPYRISYRTEDQSVVVNLVPSLAKKDVGYMVVASVRFSVKNSESGEDAKEKSHEALLHETIGDEFGPPTQKRGRDTFWCSKLSPSNSGCDKNATHLKISGKPRIQLTGFTPDNTIVLSNPELERVWLDELTIWAKEMNGASNLKYSSRYNNISTHLCRGTNIDSLFLDCKVGEPNGDTVEIISTNTEQRFSEFDRSLVFKIVDIDQLKPGAIVGVANQVVSSEGKQYYDDIRTDGRLVGCELVELKSTTVVTLKCGDATFDTQKQWAAGLESY